MEASAKTGLSTDRAASHGAGRVLTINGTKTRRWSADKGYDAEVTAFLRAVRGESPLEVTVLDGVRATAVALRAIEAAATATRLAVDWRGCL